MAKSTENTPRNKILKFFRKNGLTIFLVAIAVILTFSPGTKSWMLQQIGKTGLFNAHIDQDSKDKLISDFNFTDLNGQIYNTARLRGKVLFINFWASWCPPCKAEMPSIQHFYNQMKDDSNIVFVILNEDNNSQTGKGYLEKMNYTLPLLAAAGPVAPEIYKGTLPTTTIVDKKGRIRYRHRGFGNYDSDKFLQQMRALADEP